MQTEPVHYIHSQKGYRMNDFILSEGLKAIQKKDWKEFEKVTYYDAENAVMLLYLHEQNLPKEVKCRIALHHYVHHGDLSSIIRKYVRMALPYRPENWREALPETVRNLDSFVVYRAGSEPIEKAKYSISWTLLLDTAEWFAARHKHYRPQEKQHLYRATISADKVIAYLDDCGEFEIVQYRNVKNVEELPIRGASTEYMDICEQERNSRQIYEPHCSPKELYFNQWYINSIQRSSKSFCL